MGVLLDNVIPNNHNRTFDTNATDSKDLITIKQAILRISGVEKVEVNSKTFQFVLLFTLIK